MHRTLCCGLVWLSISAASVNRPLDPIGLRVIIGMVNSPAVPVKSIERAERVAWELLAKAGIQALWSDCTSRTCDTDLRIQLLQRKPAIGRGDVAGFAVLAPQWREGDSYAEISYPAVEAMARDLDADTARLLGLTLAHEIGHLLLGRAHAAAGVMRPHLGRGEMAMYERGELRFTVEEAEILRAEVRRRTQR